MPRTQSIQRLIRRIKSGMNYSSNFTTLSAIELHEELVTLNDEIILKYDTGSDDIQRILIFSNDKLISFFKSCSIVQADGTFNVSPKLFDQVYIFHGTNNGLTVPVFYCLLPSRTQQIYEKVARCIMEITGINLHLRKIVMDFELAAQKGFKNIFNVDIQGCFYHLQEANYRHLCTIGGKIRYSNDPEYAIKIRMFGCLAFLPKHLVRQGFQALIDKFLLEMDQPFEDFVQYFQRIYVGSMLGNVERPPRFSIEIWNLHETVISDENRTNNHVEGHHLKLKALAGCYHPTIQKFVEIIKKDISLASLKVVQSQTGQAPLPKRTNYKDLDDRVKRVVMQFPLISNYEDTLLIEFLKNMAQIFVL